ncbi:MAG: recombination mediator RecR [Minisyncoccia bacterium]|jgi:recombination protein RecR
MIPKPIKRFIDAFSQLPALGPRQATRLAFYLSSLPKATLDELEKSLKELKNLEKCERCFFLKETGSKFCQICSDPKRDAGVVAIVEKETDLISLERAGNYSGQYFILGKLADKGTLETAQKLRLENLKSRIKSEGGKLKELIIALNPTALGDFTADLIKRDFKDLAEKISRLSRGLPTGGEVEFADEATLSSALERRY